MSHQYRTNFRHEADDKQRWFDAADACGLTLSEFIRAALDHAAAGTALPRQKSSVVLIRMDPAALAQLTGACNNLNQAVHIGHIAGQIDVKRVEALAEEIVAFVRADLVKAGSQKEEG